MERLETVTVDDLAAGGDGIARVRGKVCFVRLGAPGDRLRIRITQKKKRLLRGEIVEVLIPSPQRRKPPCVYFGQCGGCQWLHLDPALQVEAKARMLKRALGLAAVEVVPSPVLLGYRRMARFHYIPRGDGTGVLGFTRLKSREVVDIDHCPILTPELSDCMLDLKNQLLTHINTPVEVRVAHGANGIIAVIAGDWDLTPEFYASARSAVPDRFVGVVISEAGYQSTVAGQKNTIIAAGDGTPLVTPAAGFAQVNPHINLSLGQTVAGWLDQGTHATALELFAGAGNWTGILAKQIRRVKAVEIDTAACRALQENVDRRGLKGVTVLAKNAFEAYTTAKEAYDLVVLDPPRTGDLDLARVLARGSHRALLYISCDPATLSRDLAELNQGGYHIKAARGFDMFPNTPHMESAVLLER
ncbi:MAG: TRAM domain-containing protein [Myxococcota bacterium]|nr:TRAM domain-containing protein [Myxococcota bacterium]